jgi:hypothetical protein
MVPPGSQLNCLAPSDIDRRAPASEALPIAPIFRHNTVLPETSDILAALAVQLTGAATNYIGVILTKMC